MKIDKILIGSNNKNKINEINSIIKDKNLRLKILGLSDIGITEKPTEDGNTFYQNAYKKAIFFYERSSLPVISEDSGLVVESLNGEPGVYSARYSGENASDEENIKLLLDKMRKIENRSAYFEACFIFFDGKNIVTKTGRTYGYITTEKRGNNGFGYDPVFFSPILNKTFAEATEEEKNSVSHRAIALKELIEELIFLEII